MEAICLHDGSLLGNEKDSTVADKPEPFLQQLQVKNQAPLPVESPAARLPPEKRFDKLTVLVATSSQ
jgi:hypothetical protein